MPSSPGLPTIAVEVQAHNAALRTGLAQAEREVDTTTRRMDRMTRTRGPFSAMRGLGAAMRLGGGVAAASLAVGGAGALTSGFGSAMRGDYRGTLDNVGRMPIFGPLVKEVYGLIDAFTGAAEAAQEFAARQSAAKLQIEQATFHREARQRVAEMKQEAERQAKLAESQGAERARLKAEYDHADRLREVDDVTRQIMRESQKRMRAIMEEAGFTSKTSDDENRILLESRANEKLRELQQYEAAASHYRGVLGGSIVLNSPRSMEDDRRIARQNLEGLQPTLDRLRAEYESMADSLRKARAEQDATNAAVSEAQNTIKDMSGRIRDAESRARDIRHSLTDVIGTALGSFKVSGRAGATESTLDKAVTELKEIKAAVKQTSGPAFA
jgi:chromosome segregation ATPase